MLHAMMMIIVMIMIMIVLINDDDCHVDLFLGWSELCDVCVVALLHTPEKMTSYQ